ncbi:MAG: hypothetical protein Q7T03_10625 [Deltaproteobacteria bacterium]|nr:hypothetical protein [Deltaproteobacteria bacterium]
MTLLINTVQFTQSLALQGALNLQTGALVPPEPSVMDAAFLPVDVLSTTAQLAMLCAGKDTPRPHRKKRSIPGQEPAPIASGVTLKKMFPKRKIRAAGVLDPFNARILNYYKEQLPQTHIALFQNYVLPLAEKVLGDIPNLYERLLKRLIDIAQDLSPKEMGPFWKTEVTEDTFVFQESWEALKAKNSHVFRSTLFTAVRLNTVGDVDSISGRGMEFVDAPLHVLAARLVGLMMIKDGKTSPDLFSEMLAEDARFLPTQWGILAVHPFKGGSRVRTPLVTAYNGNHQERHVPHLTSGPVLVQQVIPIPFTFLTDTQERDLTYAAKTYFQMKKGSTEIFNAINQTDYVGMYILAQQWEMAVRLALLKYAKDL